jgi:hypothetical protein
LRIIKLLITNILNVNEIRLKQFVKTIGINRLFAFLVSKAASYEAFNMRINRLSESFRHLVNVMLSGYCPDDCHFDTSLLDSVLIITCSGKRTPSVTKEITDKGYCSTKSIYYYGLSYML